MNINVNKQGYNLHVKVTMSSRQACQQKKRCDISTVLNWLETHHPEYKKDIVSTLKTPIGVISNYSSRLSGEWVFELKQPPPLVVTPVKEVPAPTPTVKKKTTRSRKPRKKQKTKATTLDEE
jgi:hypothetical protein